MDSMVLTKFMQQKLSQPSAKKKYFQMLDTNKDGKIDYLECVANGSDAQKASAKWDALQDEFDTCLVSRAQWKQKYKANLLAGVEFCERSVDGRFMSKTDFLLPMKQVYLRNQRLRCDAGRSSISGTRGSDVMRIGY
jgi:hypothetical protein